MKKILIGLGIGVGLIVLFFITCVSKIGAGYAGIEYSPSGGVKEKVLSQGWHIVSPFNTITEYTIATEQVYMSSDSREGSRDDESVLVSTNDGKKAKVSIEYSYRYDVDNVSNLYKRFRGQSGEDVAESFMRGKIRTYIGEVTTKYSILELYGEGRSKINEDILKNVRSNFAKDFIIIESANIIDVEPDEETNKAIQARVNSQQELERQKIEAEKAKIEAYKNFVEAEGKNNVMKAKADAEAYSIKAKAEADAYALKVRQKEITQQLIDYERATKTKGFDGVQTLILGSDDKIINNIK